jgi:RNA polymerase sigma-70 factor (ECF subfamily)
MTDACDRHEPFDEPEAWIVAIAQRQDRSCFVALFTRFAPRVKGYLLRHGLGEHHAEELAQETLLTVWRKAGQFDPTRASAAAWIYTIARNRQVDALRRERLLAEVRVHDDIPDQATPEQELRASQGGRSLHAAIEALAPEQAEVLKLSFFEEQTHAQIARQLCLPLGTVKSRIRLASARLRSALDGLD